MKRGVRIVTRTALAGWVIATTLICSSLLARHLLPLPAPRASHLASGLDALRVARDRPVVFHVLFAGCRCSHRVLESLVTVPRPAHIEEHAILVDDADGAMRGAFRDRPFVVHDVTSADLAPHFGIESAPLLVVSAADGSLRYIGGYTDRKQAWVVRDRAIVDAALAGGTVAPLPVYGCPVSEKLRAERNPLSLF